jgi:hypothetical protein
MAAHTTSTRSSPRWTFGSTVRQRPCRALSGRRGEPLIRRACAAQGVLDFRQFAAWCKRDRVAAGRAVTDANLARLRELWLAVEETETAGVDQVFVGRALTLQHRPATLASAGWRRFLYTSGSCELSDRCDQDGFHLLVCKMAEQGELPACPASAEGQAAKATADTATAEKASADVDKAAAQKAAVEKIAVDKRVAETAAAEKEAAS